MSVAKIVADDNLVEIEISDLRPALWATLTGFVPGMRLSTHLRAQRYVASLLAMVLLALCLAPGECLSPRGSKLMTPARAQSASLLDQPDPGTDRSLPWQRAPRLPVSGNVRPDDAVPRQHMTFR